MDGVHRAGAGCGLGADDMRHNGSIITFYSWYAGRFAGVARMIRDGKGEHDPNLIGQLLSVLEAYERERVALDRRLGDGQGKD